MFYLINKPLGFTSFDVIRKLRKITGIKKMGHTGTLDPLASGCLLIATENSTKLISKLENHTKTYLFTVDISISSPSLDLGTEATKVDIENMQDHTNDELVAFLENQTTQLPPKYSAIHIQGKRAYDLVRAGKEFEIKEREIQVNHVEIIEKNLPIISIRLTISSGGYIRSFGPIIGQFFGTSGGCITSLTREYIGNINISDCQSIDNFDVTRSIPYDHLFDQTPRYNLEERYKKNLIDGIVINIGSDTERDSGNEILIYCDDICSLGRWTKAGIEVIRNYV